MMSQSIARLLMLAACLLLIVGCAAEEEKSIVGLWQSADGSVHRAFHKFKSKNRKETTRESGGLFRSYHKNADRTHMTRMTGRWLRQGDNIELRFTEMTVPNGAQLNVRGVKSPVKFQLEFAEDGGFKMTPAKDTPPTDAAAESYDLVTIPTAKQKQLESAKDKDRPRTDIARRFRISLPVADWLLDVDTLKIQGNR